MVRAPIWQTALNAGEISPLLLGQFKLEKYKNACKQLVNANPLIQGPVRKRKGSYYTANTNGNGQCWLFEFIYDRFDAYVIEAGNNYFRFYRNRAQVQAGGGGAYTLATPWTYADLTNQNDGTFNLRFVQSNDVIYICTQGNTTPAYVLERFANNNWTLTPFAPVGGPFQDINATNTTVYASAQTGTVTLTASASIFQAGHVGMLFYLGLENFQFIPQWEPSKQQFSGNRIRANGNTYISNAAAGVNSPGQPLGTPGVPLSTSGSTPLLLALYNAIAIDVANANGAAYLAAVKAAFVLLGGTSASYAAINTALNTAVTAGGTTAAINTAQTTIVALLPAWSGASAGLYTGTIQPAHGSGVQFDGSGSCADPFGTSPATVPCGVPWQFEDPGYGLVLITGYTSGTQVTGTVQPTSLEVSNSAFGPFLPYYCTGPANLSTNWAFGLWGSVAPAAYPQEVKFYRQRLCWGTGKQLTASVVESFTEYYATTGGQTLADDAVNTAIEEQGAIIQWMLPLDALSIGAAGGEFTAAEQNISNPFGPLNIKLSPQTNYGSSGVTPVRIGNAIFFVDATGIILRRIENNQQSAWTGQNTAPSQTDIAEHILRPGCLQIKYSPLPYAALTCVRSDGIVARFDVNKDEEVFAWSRTIAGGYQEAAKNVSASVFSVATIPSPTGNSTDVYLAVERFINGSISRTIEIIRDQNAAPTRNAGETIDSFQRRLNDWQCDQFHVDCGLTYNVPVAITGMSATNPITVTAPAHGFSNGYTVRFDGITSTWLLNARAFPISGVTANTFQIPFDGTSIPAFAAIVPPGGAGAVVRNYVSSVSGLTQLIGETVAITVDGSAHPNAIVSAGGTVTLQFPGTRVHAGEPYSMLVDILTPPIPGQAGETEGSEQKVDHMIIRFDNTLGGWIGPNVDTLTPINFRQVSDVMDLATPAFTGLKMVEVDQDWDRDRNLVFQHSDPLPCTICAMGYLIEANEDADVH